MSKNEWLSEPAVEIATRCLRHFYPTNTPELARKVLTAAATHMEGMKRGTARKSFTLPDPAIEDAAKVIYYRDSTDSWDSTDDRLRSLYKEDARVVLDAVALHLQ